MFVPVLKSFSTTDAKIDADADCANNFFVSADVNGANILTVSADAVNILCWRAHHCLNLYFVRMQVFASMIYRLIPIL